MLTTCSLFACTQALSGPYNIINLSAKNYGSVINLLFYWLSILLDHFKRDNVRDSKVLVIFNAFFI